jgi:cellulose synthase operon protein C
MMIPESELAEIYALYEQGLYLRAFQVLERYGTPEELKGTAERLIAARTLAQLGADRRSCMLFYRTYREDRTSVEARYYYVRTVLRRRGPVAAWNLLRKRSPLDSATAAQRAEWMAQEGCVLSTLRDFESAEGLFARAEDAAPGHPWVQVERASALQAEDRYEEALDTALRCLEVRPFYPAAVRAAAELLQLLRREDEALQLLAEACERTESGLIAAQLLAIQTERGLFAEARVTLERANKLIALPDEDYREWAIAMAFDIAYQHGDFVEAVAQARKSSSPYFERVAPYIESAPGEARSVLLPVHFVRQHHSTCAPATLAALSEFWRIPADHLEIADDICYDGTPWHSERAWAEGRGFHTREFTVTWDAAVALLDRGVPFTLTTTGPGYAHLQAVVGYDERRGVLLLRDPFTPFLRPALGRELLEDLRPYGPRGLAIAPGDRSGLFDGIDLPDTQAYDALYAVQRALEAHRRDDAVQAMAAMPACEPVHQLTLHARRAIAAYDADLPRTLEVIEQMRARFPDEPNLVLAHLGCLRELGRRTERLELLESLTGTPLKRVKTPAPGEVDTASEARRMMPVYWQQYARELSEDARDHPRALTLVARAIRYAPTDGANLATLASLLWDELRRAEASELYRFAACLEPYHERFARSYFIASRWLGKTEEALRFLSGRFKRLGHRSTQPAETLFFALEQLGRTTEAFTLLEDAIARWPEDGAMLQLAAEVYARYGRFDEATTALDKAADRSARSAVLRARARLATLQNDAGRSIELWREIAVAEPLAIDAISETARLTTQTEGPDATSRYFEELARRFPHHAGVHREWAVWLRGQDTPEQRIGVLRRLREINGADAWCRRELAVALAQERAFDEAIVEAETAWALEPSNATCCSALGEVCALADRVDEAREWFRRALALRVDEVHALTRLVGLADNVEEMRDALRFAADEMARQNLFGDGLLTFRRMAHRGLPGAEVDALLQKVFEARADLWEAWAALIEERRDTSRLPEAAQLAEQATSRFPLQAGLWMIAASVRAAGGDHEGERDAIQEALNVAPGDSGVMRELAAAWERSGDLARARQIQETAVRNDPLDPQNHAAMAYYLWASGEKEAALDSVRRLLRIEPDHEWGWSALQEWSSAMGRRMEAEQMARDLASRRPGCADSWLTLARTLQRQDQLDERLSALDRALELDRRRHDARDLKAELLMEAERLDEAEAACCLPAAEGDAKRLPMVLRRRLAMIEAARGRLKEAAATLGAALQDDPAYHDGWVLLRHWRQQLGDADGAAEASRSLTRLLPNNATSWGYLGQALLDIGDRAEAKPALRRGLEIDPGYRYAAFALVDAHLKDKEFGEAQAVAELVQRNRHEGWPLAISIRVAVKRKDAPAASGLLRELCLMPGSIDEIVRDAEQRMTEGGMTQQVRATCDALLETDGAQPEAGALWARACTRTNYWRGAARLRSIGHVGDIADRAVAAWVSAIIEARRVGDLKRLMKANRQWMWRRPKSWGSASYALFSLRDFRGAVEWTDDWQRREEVRPWMLLNRAMALRALGRAEAAAETSRCALQLLEDSCTPRHALWLLVEAQLRSDEQEQERMWPFVRRVDSKALPAYYRCLVLIASALRASDSAPTGNGRAFTEARTLLFRARRAYPGFLFERTLQSVYDRAVGHIARRRSTAPALAWGALQRLCFGAPWWILQT